jgi:phosphoribosyl-dephospho-CoA transferase
VVFNAAGACSRSLSRKKLPAMTNPVSARRLIASDREGSALSELPDLRGLRRHHLLWVRPEYHASISAQTDDATLRGLVTEFLAAGWPLVMRRQSDGDCEPLRQSRSIAVGMPLPPSQGKLRLAFVVPPESIMRVAPPLTLVEVIARLPESWRSSLRQLLRSAEAANIQFRVFGSAAWEALTGRCYLSAHSDIDLLWQPCDASQIDAGIALLEAWEAQTGLVVDGEIAFGDDVAGAWREWSIGQLRQSASHRVLVKTLHGPHLSSRAELLALITQCRAEPIEATVAA